MIDKEEWKIIDGYPNHKISNYGNVFSTRSNRELKLFIDKRGYKHIELNQDGVAEKFRVHRLVCKHFCKEGREDQVVVNHIDTNTSNNYYKNLEWSTQKENVNHSKDLGNYKIGEKSIHAKLTDDEVKEICELLVIGKDGFKKIAGKYNVCKGNIFNIYSGRAWKHISNDYTFFDRGQIGILNEEIVRKICLRIIEGISNVEIAEAFNISRRAVYEIKTQKTWKTISKVYF